MNREQFRARFAARGTAPLIFPVIHVLDTGQAAENIRVAVDAGAPGVFLINHDFEQAALLPIIREIRLAFPDLWLGINFLAVTGKHAFPILGELEREGIRTDAYWADDARIDERTEAQPEAEEIARVRADSGWSGLYFGGTAFKKQRPVAEADYGRSAAAARGCMDVVTTSGPATGRAADISKIETFREHCADSPLAVASGITPDNVSEYAGLLDAILVATGINREGDFYNIDGDRLAELIRRVGAR